jgi:FAD/FMN-containing dehydrogenase
MPAHAPPPIGFRGAFHLDEERRREAAGSRGPVWLLPAAVLCPADAEDVVRAVLWAREHGLPLVPRGAATGMPGGNVGSGAVLDLSGLDDIGEPDPDSGVIEAGAGAVAGVVDAHARRGARRLPAPPASARWCTVGGMVACDAAGARSFRHGPTHAWLEGVEAVRSDGALEWPRAGGEPWAGLHAELSGTLGATPAGWPRTRKNSSGYALDRFLPTGDPVQLLCGSEGTLAVVTRVRLRTLPVPAARAAVLLGLPAPSELPALASAAGELGASACELFGTRLLELAGDEATPWLEGLDAAAGVVLLEFEGEADDLAAAVSGARTLGRRVGGSRIAADPADVDALWEIRHAASPTIARAARHGFRSIQFMEDGIVPLPALATYLSGVDSILSRHGTRGVIFGHAGDGHLHVNPLVDLTRADWRVRVRSMLEESVALVTELGGTLAGEHGDGRVRAPFLDAVWRPHLAAAFRRVKAFLDPHGLLNPGVVVPLPGQDPLEGLGDGPDLQAAVPGTEAP